MRRFKQQSLIHFVVLCNFLLFNNCSGFNAGEIDQLQLSSGTPSGASGMTKVFMATGHMGRTVMSCDDGRTWINDRSDDPNARCWVDGHPNYVECSHDARANVGSDSGDGYFFANYGWGYAGSLRKTRDGINWETIKTGGWGGGVTYANSQLWLLWDSWFLSSDFGANWIGSPTPILDIAYDHPHGYRLGTKFIAASRNKGIAVSRDQGNTWEIPQGFDSKWSNAGIVEGNGIQVSIGQVYDQATQSSILYSARSTDQGKTWIGQLVDPKSAHGLWGNLVFNGKAFVAWSFLAMWKSVDGITWTATPISYSSPVNMWNTFGAIGFNQTTGTYVMITGYHYDQQKAALSTNGVDWTFLPSSQLTGGHPITRIIVGEIESKYCP